MRTCQREDQGDVHTKNGGGMAQVSDDKLLVIVGFGGGDLVEGMRDHENVVDVNKDGAYVT
jgi:hypothetical protein